MLITIQSRGFVLSAALKKHVKSRVRLALDRYRSEIASINVTLVDIKSAEGDEDRHCKISLKPNRFSEIVVQETGADIYEAINMCAHRAMRSASRQFTKLKQQRKVSRLGYSNTP